MIFEEKTIILKDGRTAILKSPCVEDAEKLLNYIKKSCSETDFCKLRSPTAAGAVASGHCAARRPGLK